MTTQTPRNNGLLPRVSSAGNRIFITNVLPVAADGKIVDPPDIKEHNHAAFRMLKRALHLAGCDFPDLVRLNTYYLYSGSEAAATRYWEEMTQARIQYFPNPGPVATGLRVAGVSDTRALVQLEAEALVPELRPTRARIMPKESWDWTVPLPLSQGWRQEKYIWVGGQISSDKQGRTLHSGDIGGQTRAVMRHILNVLRDAGATANDLLHLKICYSHDGNAETRLGEIARTIRSLCGASEPAITAFGANMIYEGLLLEIDATAVVADRAAVDVPSDNLNWLAKSQAVRRGQYIHVSGQSARGDGGAPIADSARRSSRRLLEMLKAAGGAAENVARITAFVARSAVRGSDDLREARKAVESVFEPKEPPISLVVVSGLPSEADVQIDALAMAGEKVKTLDTERI